MRLRNPTNLFLRFGVGANIAFIAKICWTRLSLAPGSCESERCEGKKTFFDTLPSFSHLPKLHKTELEALRLNELIAHTQYTCRNTTTFGRKHGMMMPLSHKICSDQDPLAITFSNETTFLSVLSFGDNLEFEKTFLQAFPSASGVIFSPFEDIVRDNFPQLLDGHYSSVQLHYDSPGQESSSHLTARILEAARTLDSIDIVKLDSLDGSQQDRLLDLIDGLIDQGILKSTTHILLTIRMETAKSPTTYRWHSALHQLFYRSSFAIYAAIQSGQCGKRVARCQYRVSLIRFPPDGSKDIRAPLVGMSTPDEEFQRWYHYLLGPSGSDRLSSEGTPLRIGTKTYSIDTPSPNSACLIYAFMMPDLAKRSSLCEASFPGNPECELHIFNPTFAESRNSVGLFHHNFTLATSSKPEFVPGLSPDAGNWSLRPIREIVAQLGHTKEQIRAIVLDLEGMEWNVMEGLLASDIVRNQVEQIIFRIRLWYGEEFENEQQKYSWFYRLELAGFRKDPAHIISHQGQHGHSSTLDVRFVRKTR